MPVFSRAIPFPYLCASMRCGALRGPFAAPMRRSCHCPRAMRAGGHAAQCSRAVANEPSFFSGALLAAGLFLKGVPGCAAAVRLAAPEKARTEHRP